MSDAHPIVELREGGEVRAALVLPGSDARVHLLVAGGREMRVPRSRIVHQTGETVSGAGTAALAEGLAAWERRADARAAEVDIPALHGLLLEEGASATGTLELADLAALALGDESGLARAAVHRALARATTWFRFHGESWTARPLEEVEAELQKRQRAEQLEREREAFLAVARRRLAGSGEALPPLSGKFLRSLRDVALLGDLSKLRREAATLVHEMESRPEGPPPSEEHAFELLVALGEMPKDENLALLRAGVAIEFSPDILAAAESAAARPPGDFRVDCRSLDIVAIDDATTTEVDDGVSLERTPRGWRLGVHIADAAHFVDKGSALDLDIESRATSYYLPERVIKMMPPALATGAASLMAGEDRPALSFFAELTPGGELLGFDVQETLIRISRRLTYEECEAVLGGETGLPWLRELAALARTLEEERLARGATPIRAHEISIEFDAAGEPIVTLVDPGRPARQLVAELMVLANRLAAAWCRDRGLPAIYRKQARSTGTAPAPPRDRVDPLAAFEFRKTLQRTEVSLEPGPHSGLGVDCYLQATSPIRRYQDLAQHRIIKAALRGQRMPYTREELMAVAHATEQAGRQARSIETETDRYWILRALEHRIGDELEAIVLRTEDRHTLVELREYSYITSLAKRPDHARGQQLRLRIRGSRPRRGTLTVEEIHEPPAASPADRAV